MSLVQNSLRFKLGNVTAYTTWPLDTAQKCFKSTRELDMPQIKLLILPYSSIHTYCTHHNLVFRVFYFSSILQARNLEVIMVFAPPSYLPAICSPASGSVYLSFKVFLEAVHFFPSSSSIIEVILLRKCSLSTEPS